MKLTINFKSLAQRLKLQKQKRILGLPFYQKLRSETELLRIFLFGFFAEHVFFNEEGEYARNIYCLRFLILQKRTKNLLVDYYLFGYIKLWTVDLGKALDKSLSRLFSDTKIIPINGKKQVFVFWANSGEIALLLSLFFEKILRQLGIRAEEEFVILCTKAYHKHMLSMYFPKARVVVSKPLALRYMTGDCIVGDWKITMFFPGKYFAKFESFADQNKTVNYYDWMKHWLDINKPTVLAPDTKIMTDCHNQALSKLSHLKLDYDKLAIVAEDSFSGHKVDSKLFDEIKSCLQENGFSVYVNRTNKDDPAFLTYPEIFALARQAKIIIGVRSGLMDFLAATGKPLIVLYTGFLDRGFNTPPKAANQVLKMFSINTLPYYSNFPVQELNAEDSTREEISYLVEKEIARIKG